MDALLRDLYGHQVWADAEHWRAIGAHAPARDDKAIRDRLHHIAIVQRAFLWTVGDRQDAFAFTKPEDFPSFDALLMRIHPAASRVKKLSEETPAKLIVFDLLVDDRGKAIVDSQNRLIDSAERRNQNGAAINIEKS